MNTNQKKAMNTTIKAIKMMKEIFLNIKKYKEILRNIKKYSAQNELFPTYLYP